MKYKVKFGWHTVRAMGEFVTAHCQRRRYERIDCNALKSLLHHEPSLTVVDCRDPEDYADGHIAGAVNMPFQTFMKRCSETPKAGKTVAVCYVGMYSRAAAQALCTKGYGVVYSLDGGMDAWMQADEPVITTTTEMSDTA